MQVRFDDKLIYDRGYKLELKYPSDLMIEWGRGEAPAGF